jgi:hypothetical protein
MKVPFLAICVFVFTIICPCLHSKTVNSKELIIARVRCIKPLVLISGDENNIKQQSDGVVVVGDERGYSKLRSFGLSAVMFMLGFVWSIVQETKLSIAASHGGDVHYSGTLKLVSSFPSIPISVIVFSHLARALSYKVWC